MIRDVIYRFTFRKAKGNDAAMSAHIDRTIHPKNADKTREYLNKEFIVYPRDVKPHSCNTVPH